MISVVMAGVSGKTGRAVGQALYAAHDIELVGAIARQHVGKSLGAIWGNDATVRVVDSIDAIDVEGQIVLVDFTEAESAYGRILMAIRRDWDVVVGTTGFSVDQKRTLFYEAERHQVGAVFITNFSLGAWLQERLAAESARFFSDVEIIEGHNIAKRDRPSGTAKQMQKVLGHVLHRDPEDIPLHSVRLPGMVAHQDVVLGGSGEVLTLRHDVHDRGAYAAGVLTAVRKVGSMHGQVITDFGQMADPS